jgi:hypothetical protein
VVGNDVGVVPGHGVCCRLWRWAQPGFIAIEVFSLRGGVGARSGCGLRDGSGRRRGNWWLFGVIGGLFCDWNDESKINISDIVSPVLESVYDGSAMGDGDGYAHPAPRMRSRMRSCPGRRQ